MATLWNVLTDPNARWIMGACALLGLSSGVIGVFAYLRRQSMLGDALAHAALPGVCVAYMLTGVKSVFAFLLGAAGAGLLATFAIGYITRNTKIKQDASLGIILSVFFGMGIVLLTYIQHNMSGSKSGLDKFLLGQAASLVRLDVYVMMGMSALLIGVCALFYKHFKLVSFDPSFARGLGWRVAALEQLMMLLIVFAVIVGIQAVGVVLMAALLITPAVTARYWTQRLSVMVVLSGLFGGLSGIAGTLLSTAGNNLPTGPLCVLSATVLFVISLLLAPERGVLARLRIRQALRRQAAAGKLPIRREGEAL